MWNAGVNDERDNSGDEQMLKWSDSAQWSYVLKLGDGNQLNASKLIFYDC